MNHKIYQDIFNQIYNDEIRNFTIHVLRECPEELETIPASISGKYHPLEARQVGGLVWHVQRACWFANMFFHAYGWKYDNIKADIVLSALLLHDISKKSKYSGNYDYVNHPTNAALFIDKFKGEISQNIFQIIRNCIIHHMGNWTPISIRKPIEKYTLLELIVYQCDYLSSKKELAGDM